MGKREEWEAYAIRLCFVLTLLVGVAWGFFIGVLVLR